jgi:hypothetical protein
VEGELGIGILVGAGACRRGQCGVAARVGARCNIPRNQSLFFGSTRIFVEIFEFYEIFRSIWEYLLFNEGHDGNFDNC